MAKPLALGTTCLEFAEDDIQLYKNIIINYYRAYNKSFDGLKETLVVSSSLMVFVFIMVL